MNGFSKQYVNGLMIFLWILYDREIFCVVWKNFNLWDELAVFFLFVREYLQFVFSAHKDAK